MSNLAVAEIDNGVVHNDKRDLPIFADVDVVVAGGGMSGYAAAVTASRTASCFRSTP